jgi:diaminopimelate decarboxylase
MNYFKDVLLKKIAKEIGTPCYVYSKQALINNWNLFNNAFGNSYAYQINYAVKANSNLAVLNILRSCGSGFDIVSIGELERVLAVNGDVNKIIFSGVGKTTQELLRALEVGVGCINIESEEELVWLNQLAINANKIANIAIRVNPDVASGSHPYISTGMSNSKFGVSISDAKKLYKLANDLAGINIQGIAFHIGSQITELSPFILAIDKILELIKYLNSINIKLKHINVGGGLGVSYSSEQVPSPEEYIKALLDKLQPTGLMIYIEPGRAIAASAGILLTKVEYIKQQDDYNKYFAIVDAAMNDLLRPALYDAWHDILVVSMNNKAVINKIYDIVGPVCETADCLGKDRLLAIKSGDLLKICTVGAYGFSMSSNYNSRARAAEVVIDGEEFFVVRPREDIIEPFKSEKIC